MCSLLQLHPVLCVFGLFYEFTPDSGFLTALLRTVKLSVIYMYLSNSNCVCVCVPVCLSVCVFSSLQEDCTCTVCGKVVAAPRLLGMHMRTHGERKTPKGYAYVQS